MAGPALSSTSGLFFLQESVVPRATLIKQGNGSGNGGMIGGGKRDQEPKHLNSREQN